MQRCVWMLLFVLLTTAIPKTSSVRLLLIRENGESRSEEEPNESLDAEESEEIDFLLDLVKNEARNRKPPPVTTVRIVKRKPEAQLVAQHSIRKERVEAHPKAFKEYHVHYHNHQHKEPSKPQMAFDEDSFRPIIWDTPVTPLGDFDSFKELQKTGFMPQSESARVKSFKDFETFLKSNLRSPYPTAEKYDSGEKRDSFKDFETIIKTKISNPRPKESKQRSPYHPAEKYEYDVRGEAFKDFETLIKPKLTEYRSKDVTPFERIKKFQDFMNSEEEEKGEFLNRDRFKGFRDFSEIENPPESKPASEDKTSLESVEKKGVKIRDFAIVIKSKPRAPSQSKVHQGYKYTTESKNTRPGPQIPPFVNKLRIPTDKPFAVPKVLEAAGGAPKYIDEMNKLKYPQTDDTDVPYRNPFYFNNMERNRYFHLGPVPLQSLPNFPYRNPMNSWVLKRLMR